MSDSREVIAAWKPYCADIAADWEAVADREAGEPKVSGCGPIYEFKASPKPERWEEDFCIADMRDLPEGVTEPHYHPEGVTEIYIGLQGWGEVWVGRRKMLISPGTVVVMTPRRAHFTIPYGDLVLGVINTPPFRPEHYIPLSETNVPVKFSRSFFDKVVEQARARQDMKRATRESRL